MLVAWRPVCRVRVGLLLLHARTHAARASGGLPRACLAACRGLLRQRCDSTATQLSDAAGCWDIGLVARSCQWLPASEGRGLVSLAPAACCLPRFPRRHRVAVGQCRPQIVAPERDPLPGRSIEFSLPHTPLCAVVPRGCLDGGAPRLKCQPGSPSASRPVMRPLAYTAGRSAPVNGRV